MSLPVLVNPKLTATVAYVGPAVDDGSMDVREFAPALMALGQLCEHANRLLNGDRASLNVRVQSRFDRGSFQLTLEFVQTLAQQASLLFTRENLTSAADIATLIGLIGGSGAIGGFSLLRLIKVLNGRQPSSVELSDGAVEVRIDGDHNAVGNITVDRRVYFLAADPYIRKAIADTVRPVVSPGITAFEVRRDRTEEAIERVTDADAPGMMHVPPAAFEAIEEAGLTQEREAILRVIKPSLEPGLRWVVSDGSNRFGAYMKDPAYLSRIESREVAFAQGHVLKVLLSSRTYLGGDVGLRTEYDILRVIEEIPQARQARLLPSIDDDLR